MNLYLSKDPLRLVEDGECIIYSDSFLFDPDEPISPAEIKRINEFMGQEILKAPTFFRRKSITRRQAADIIRSALLPSEE